ncbi:two-component system sensor histidine kinase DesK [Kribbella voronezhensis]|uniref:Two-component system sensor histidine kinase DesK n=1 Tax=Kribbella voronezhensis TaxID=2512212 RepID=A0A4R7TEV1_9ACTN|nr:histidine kinase [Kribbella voronezhensis]TDU90704.1 two-component system sensor histidine kinase DesK [Kribbella voronezhensis]
MVSVSGWWSRRSRAERFDISLRWPLYFVIGAAPLYALLIAFSDSRSTSGLRTALFVLLSVPYTVVALLLMRATLSAYLHRQGPSKRLLATAVGLTVLGVAVFPEHAVALLLFGGLLTLALSPLRPFMLYVGLVAVGAVMAGLLEDTAAAFVYVYGVGIAALTGRLSAWMLGMGWELDRSRAISTQLAVAEERLRFSRDLHDTLGRNLSLVAVQSELAARLAERGDEDAAEQMLAVRRIAHESLREMRAVVDAYRSTDLSSELAGAQSVLRSAGINCRVIGDVANLPDTTQVALAWVVREATTNVIHHSDATTCKIELDAGGQNVVLRMENDGVRSARPALGPGNGLVGLRERLAEVGGTLTAEPRPGGRFLLQAQLPTA